MTTKWFLKICSLSLFHTHTHTHYTRIQNTLMYGGGGDLVTKSCVWLMTPWTVAHQAPLYMKFPRQEYWSRLPFPSSGDLPNLGIEPRSSALQADSLPSEPPRKPYVQAQYTHAIFIYTWHSYICIQHTHSHQENF